MDRRVSISLIAILIMHYESSGKLIQVPRSKTVKVNESTYFNCSTSSPFDPMMIFWYHGEKFVYSGTGVYEEYKERVSIVVDNDTRSCSLVIHSVQPFDAGVYKCIENEGAGEERSSHLTVLDGDPVCQSNVKLNSIVGQNTCGLRKDEVELSCRVTYHGNKPPHMEWMKTENGLTIAGMKPSVLPAQTQQINLMLENDISLHNSAYVCRINGTTEKQYTCTSEVIRLSYSIASDEVAPVVRGSDVVCRANTTFDCKYRWFYADDSVCPVSCNQKVKAHLVGNYHCEAKCTVGGKDCTFVAMNVSVIPDEEVKTIFGVTTLVLIGVGSCLIGGIGVAVYLYLNPRKKPRNIEEALKFLEFSSSVLIHAGEKEKEAYFKKTGKDISTLFSDQMMQAFKQVHSMFPAKDTALVTDTRDDVEHPRHCELSSGNKGDGNGYDFIRKTSPDVADNGDKSLVEQQLHHTKLHDVTEE